MAIFIVLSIMFAVFWYMTWSDNQAKNIALANSTQKEQDLNEAVRDNLDEIRKLKGRIGVGENVEYGEGDDDPARDESPPFRAHENQRTRQPFKHSTTLHDTDVTDHRWCQRS